MAIKKTLSKQRSKDFSVGIVLSLFIFIFLVIIYWYYLLVSLSAISWSYVILVGAACISLGLFLSHDKDRIKTIAFGLLSILLLQAGNIPLISPVFSYEYTVISGKVNELTNTGGLVVDLELKIKPPLLLLPLANCGSLRFSDQNISYSWLRGNSLLSVTGLNYGAGVKGINVCVFTNSWNINELQTKLRITNFETVEPFSFCIRDIRNVSIDRKLQSLKGTDAIELEIFAENPNSYPVYFDTYYSLNASNLTRGYCPDVFDTRIPLKDFFRYDSCYRSLYYGSGDYVGIYSSLKSSDSKDKISDYATRFTGNLVIFNQISLPELYKLPLTQNYPVVRIYRVPCE